MDKIAFFYIVLFVSRVTAMSNATATPTHSELAQYADEEKRKWYNQSKKRIQNELLYWKNRQSNAEDEVKKFREKLEASIQYNLERAEHALSDLGPYVGQCLHQGTQTQVWISRERFDFGSDGYDGWKCDLCGKEDV